MAEIRSTKFRVIYNNGKAEGRYSNACIWISIRDYMQLKHNQHHSIDELRRLSGFTPRYPNNVDYDDMDPSHRKCLLQLLNILNLSIEMYIIYGNRTAYLTQTIGNERYPRVHIISYGAHFELIVAINDRYLIDTPEARKASKEYKLQYLDPNTMAYVDLRDIKKPPTKITVNGNQDRISVMFAKIDENLRLITINKAELHSLNLMAKNNLLRTDTERINVAKQISNLEAENKKLLQENLDLEKNINEIIRQTEEEEKRVNQDVALAKKLQQQEYAVLRGGKNMYYNKYLKYKKKYLALTRKLKNTSPTSQHS
jgi:hypothetical protein